MTENFPRYPAVFITLAFAAGIVLQHYLAAPLAGLLGVSGCSIIVSWILHRRNHSRPYHYLVIFFVLGALRYGFWANDSHSDRLASLYPLNCTTIEGKVADSAYGGGKTFTLRTEILTLPGLVVPVHENFLVRSRRNTAPCMPGDKVILDNVRLENLPVVRNPGQFDYGRYLKFRGIKGIVNIPDSSRIHLVANNSIFSFQKLVSLIRLKIDKRINQLLPDKDAAFVKAVLLGNKSGLSRRVKEEFRDAGVAHILAVSGLHTGFIVIIAYVILSFLPISFRYRHLLTIFVLLIYMMLTGANPPVVRAALMVGIYLIGKILERKPEEYNTIFLSAFIILSFQPQQLFWSGFQFSYAAVFSIIYFYRRFSSLESKLTLMIKRKRNRKIVKKAILTPFFISLAAQLGTIPLAVFYFSKIPVVSFFLNILAIPLIGFIVMLAILLLSVSLFSFQLSLLLSELLKLSIHSLLQVVGWASELPVAFIRIPHIGLLMIFVYVAGIWLIFNFRQKKYRHLIKPGLAFILMATLLSTIPQYRQGEILMLDVGQGDAMLVSTPSGKTLLMDCGPAWESWDSGRDVVLPALARIGKTRLNKVVISHPHADHLGGLFSLIKSVPIDSVYFPDIRISYFLQDSLLTCLRRNGVPFRPLKMGDRVKLDNCSQLFVLAPDTSFLKPADCSGHNINNTSIVSILKIYEQSVLLTGDAEKEVEQNLLKWGTILKSDILKIGHHGSATSSSKDFLQVVSPSLSLISVGQNNKFGHPAPSVLKRLAEAGIRCFRTDKDGAMWFRLQNDRWEKISWR